MTPAFVRTMARDGQLPYFRLGRGWLFRVEDVDAALAARQGPASARAGAERRSPFRRPTPDELRRWRCPAPGPTGRRR